MPSRHFPQNLSQAQADIWNAPGFPAIRPKMDPAIIDEVLDSMPECLCSMQEFADMQNVSKVVARQRVGFWWLQFSALQLSNTCHMAPRMAMTFLILLGTTTLWPRNAICQKCRLKPSTTKSRRKSSPCLCAASLST